MQKYHSQNFLELKQYPQLQKACSYFSLRKSFMSNNLKMYPKQAKQSQNTSYSLESENIPQPENIYNDKVKQENMHKRAITSPQIPTRKKRKRMLSLQNYLQGRNQLSHQIYSNTTPCVKNQQLYFASAQQKISLGGTLGGTIAGSDYSLHQSISKSRFQRLKSPTASTTTSKTYIQAMKALQAKLKLLDKENASSQVQNNDLKMENTNLKLEIETIKQFISNKELRSGFSDDQNILEVLEELFIEREKEAKEKVQLQEQIKQLESQLEDQEKVNIENGVVAKEMAKVLKENTELTNQINELKIQYNEQLENFKKEITDIQEENKKNLQIQMIEMEQMKEENDQLKDKLKSSESFQQLTNIMMLSGFKHKQPLTEKNSIQEESLSSPYSVSSKKKQLEFKENFCQYHSSTPVKKAKHKSCQKIKKYEEMLQQVIQKEKNIVFLNRRYSNTFLSPENNRRNGSGYHQTQKELSKITQLLDIENDELLKLKQKEASFSKSNKIKYYA